MTLLDIVSTFVPTFASDKVAVYNQDFEQLFRRARAIRAVVKEESRLMEHPMENGAIITDHRIILPVEIELNLILASVDYQDVYRDIRQYYLDGDLLVVQTRSDIYDNQIIQAMPHEEDPDQYDVISMILQLKQVQFARVEFGVVPRNTNNATTQNRGAQQATPANTTQTSTARGWLDNVRSSLNWVGSKVGL